MSNRNLTELPCWLCLVKHSINEFSRIDGVAITFGYMPPACRRVFDALPKQARQQLRAAGHARYEKMLDDTAPAHVVGGGSVPG